MFCNLSVEPGWTATRRSWGDRCGRRATSLAIEKCWVTWPKTTGRYHEEFHENTRRRWEGGVADRRVTRARRLFTWANRVTFLTPPPDDGTSSNSSADRPLRGSRGPGIQPRWIPTTRTTGNDHPSRIRGMVNERYSRSVRLNLFSLEIKLYLITRYFLYYLFSRYKIKLVNIYIYIVNWEEFRIFHCTIQQRQSFVVIYFISFPHTSIFICEFVNSRPAFVK